LSEPASFVDWTLATRIAGGISEGVGGFGGGRDEQADGYTQPEVAAACTESIAVVAAHTDLGVVEDPPVAELIGRREWATNALATLALASGPLEQRIGGELPGPLGSLARRALGAGAAAEAGVAVGYVARRVLGQYDLALFGPRRPARLLFVAENMAAARRELDADPDLFLRWIALHETTHVVQLERVPWLADHLRGLAGELLGGAARGFDAEALQQLARGALRNPRALVGAALRGELVRLLGDPALRTALDRLQATMSVIEGHAEHVMDTAAAEVGPGVDQLRAGLEQRRSRRSGLGGVIGRLLGIELKLQQYRLGKAFCDALVASAGPAALGLLWRSEADLPSLTELEQPQLWLARVHA